jgi:hypothetical protein
MCMYGARHIFTVGLVCSCLALAPAGAKTPPASAVGQMLNIATATSTTSGSSVHIISYGVPNTVTGTEHQLPAKSMRPATHQPAVPFALVEF